MQFAHNGSYKGSIPFGLIFIKILLIFNCNIKIFLFRAFGRVWFMALILKISTSKKSREFKSHSARSKTLNFIIVISL